MIASTTLLLLSKISDRLLLTKSFSEVLITSCGLIFKMEIIFFNSVLVRGVFKYSTIL